MFKLILSIIIISQGILFAHCDGCGTHEHSKNGVLSGNVNYLGKLPKAESNIRMDSEPTCGAVHDHDIYPGAFIADENMNLKNVLVWIKNIEYDASVPEKPAILDQKGCVYFPHVFGIMKNQKLLVKNSDVIAHNIHSFPEVNTSFNSGQPGGIDLVKSFSESEEPFYIKCDVHPWMKSWVLVQNHPYFSVTDENGNFKIEDIPPGSYEVVFWQEKLSTLNSNKFIVQPNVIEVTITANEITEQNFTFKQPKRVE